MAKAILVDTTICTACRACQVACKQWNELPAERTEFKGSYQNPPDSSPVTYTIVKFNEIEDNGDLRWLFRKHQCMQCTEATCIKVCPVQAITKHTEGFKVRDLNKCIGCGLCVTMCPFKVPKLDEKEKKARDCLFCMNRVINKMQPACVKACPSGALRFAEGTEILDYARQRLSEVRMEFPDVYLYGEKELGGLGVKTLIAQKPNLYDLPENPQVPKDVGWLRDLFDSFAMVNKDTSLILTWVRSYIKSIEAEKSVRV